MPFFERFKTNYIPDYFIRYPSDHKFDSLIRISERKKLTTNVAKFVREIFRKREKLETLVKVNRNSIARHRFSLIAFDCTLLILAFFILLLLMFNLL